MPSLPLLAAALAILAPAPAAAAQAIGGPVAKLLGQASDSALDRLARPGAFQADAAIRIRLPGMLGKAQGLTALADRTGLAPNLQKSLNDAAGVAAGQAKPIFRAAIGRMTVNDGVAIARRSDGATAYLRQSAGTELATKLQPLIAGALGRTGALAQFDKLARSGPLAAAGLSRETLIRSVADQALAGIFTYMGREEAALRANPLAAGKSLLDALGK